MTSPLAPAAVPTVAAGGRYRISVVVGGQDITRFRGVPVTGITWSSLDPGGHDSGTVNLPQVGINELDSGAPDLAWMAKGSRVVIRQIDTATNAEAAVLYRGLVSNILTADNRVSLDFAGDLIGPMSLALDDYAVAGQRWTRDAADILTNIVPVNGGVSIYAASPTGISVYRPLDRSSSRWGMVTGLLAMLRQTGGLAWTILPDADIARRYNLVRRDMTTRTYTLHLGVQGVSADLQSNLADDINRWYGEGQAPGGGRWYNLKLPSVWFADTDVPFPMPSGESITIGTANADTTSGDGLTVLAFALGRYGAVQVDDLGTSYDSTFATAIRSVQRDAGLPVTGDVDAATWDAVFSIPVSNQSLQGAKYLPLVADPRVAAYLHNAAGAIVGVNPRHDPTLHAVDEYDQFGTNVTKARATQWAEAMYDREQSDGSHWDGTITLTTDPAECSRFAIRAGGNVWAPEFGGSGRLLHIANAQADLDSLTVTLQVSTRGRDYIDLASVISRNIAARRNPERSFARSLSRLGSLTHDGPGGWDIEIGGWIPKWQIPGGQWSVLPVAAGQVGSIGEVAVHTDAPTTYCVAVWSREVTGAQMDRWVPQPLATRTDNGSWTTDPDLYQRWYGLIPSNDSLPYLVTGSNPGAKLLLYAAGSPQTKDASALPCGLYPDGVTLTGDWRDDTGFSYYAHNGIYLWLAIWPTDTTTVSGQLKPLVNDGGM